MHEDSWIPGGILARLVAETWQDYSSPAIAINTRLFDQRHRRVPACAPALRRRDLAVSGTSDFEDSHSIPARLRVYLRDEIGHPVLSTLVLDLHMLAFCGTLGSAMMTL